MKAHIGWLFTFLRKTVNSLGTPWGPHGQDLFRKLNIFEMQKACKRNVCRLFIWRSRRDSNPGALADKRFSRPPRYDHFDTAPGFCYSVVNRTSTKVLGTHWGHITSFRAVMKSANALFYWVCIEMLNEGQLDFKTASL